MPGDGKGKSAQDSVAWINRGILSGLALKSSLYLESSFVTMVKGTLASFM